MSAQATHNTGGNIHWPLQTKMITLERILTVWGFSVLFRWSDPSEAAIQLLRVPDLSCPSVAEWSDPGTRRPGLIDLYPACTSTVGGFELRHWFVDFNLARVQRLQILLCTYRSGNIYEPGLDRFYQFNLKDWTFPSDRYLQSNTTDCWLFACKSMISAIQVYGCEREYQSI